MRLGARGIRSQDVDIICGWTEDWTGVRGQNDADAGAMLLLYIISELQCGNGVYTYTVVTGLIWRRKLNLTVRPIKTRVF